MAENESGCGGVGVSYIEVDRERVSAEEMLQVERECNDAIREALPVTVKTFEAGDPELDRASTRGLPEGHTGSVRVIQIGDIDNNMCCGTHVTNLAQLQVSRLHSGLEKLHKSAGSRPIARSTSDLTLQILLSDGQTPVGR